MKPRLTTNRDAVHLLEAAQALALDAATGPVVEALRSRGIECLLLRGPALAGLLYDAPEQRPYVDVDLLVAPSRVVEAESALVDLGFTESAVEVAFPDGRPQHAHTWVSPTGRMVDLHSTLIGVGAPPKDTWRILSGETETLRLEQMEVETPSAAGLAAIVALHAAHHAGRAGRPLDDLERALERLPTETWARAAKIARELDALPAFAAGLGLLSRGAAELHRLGIGQENHRKESLRGDTDFHIAQGLAWLRATPGVYSKATFLAGRLVPPPVRMRSRSTLARRGLLGLACAYLLRWLQLTTAIARLAARSVASHRHWHRS